jgi:hypothetical protein
LRLLADPVLMGYGMPLQPPIEIGGAEKHSLPETNVWDALFGYCLTDIALANTKVASSLRAV